MKKSTKNLILFLCAAACLAFIWSNSFMTAEISGGLSAYAEKILRFIFGENFPVTEGVLRKLAHAFEFAVLGIILSLAAYDGIPKKLFTVGFCGLVTALLDETIQLFSEGRGSSVKDVWIDFMGFSAGVILIILLKILLSRGRKKDE